MISEKQDKIRAFPYSKYEALICDGSIRSGKTAIMTVAFIDWAMSKFDGVNFGLCSKTVGTCLKNVIMPYMALAYVRKRYAITLKQSQNVMTIYSLKNGHKNTFYIYGGKDESSYMLIQGITLAGILMDEVALMPKSFVEQALARCSITGSKMWFNCNPASPEHWFYKEWICNAEHMNALHLHFTFEDNPSLDESIIERYKRMYSGVFYDRYILGLWVIAEGLVYPMFDRATHVTETVQRDYSRYVMSIDYGIQNPFSIGLWGYSGGVWYRVKEYYHSGRETNQQKTDQEYYDDMCEFAGELPIECIIIDPSATSFIALIKQKHKYKVKKAKNAVIDGIQAVGMALNDGKIKINDCCVNTIKEFGLYSWDDKKQDDAVIKENDHAMDDTRYFVYTMNINKKKSEYTPIWG